MAVMGRWARPSAELRGSESALLCSARPHTHMQLRINYFTVHFVRNAFLSVRMSARGFLWRAPGYEGTDRASAYTASSLTRDAIELLLRQPSSDHYAL